MNVQRAKRNLMIEMDLRERNKSDFEPNSVETVLRERNKSDIEPNSVETVLRERNKSDFKPNFDERWLALDCSTASMAVAVMQGDRLLGEHHSLAERNHSIRLVPAMEELLQSLALTVNDLDGIAVGHGPGSYTGVRIAVTVGKTMAWAKKIPLIGVSSLEAMARGGLAAWNDEAGSRQSGGLVECNGVAGSQQSGDEPARTWVIPMIDARRGQVYTGLYCNDGAGWSCLKSDHLILLEDWVHELAERVETQTTQTILFVSSQMAPYQQSVQWLSDQVSCAVRSQGHHLQAEYVGMSARDLQRELSDLYGQEGKSVHQFVPNYAQLAEAEQKWLQRTVRGEGNG